MNRRASIIDVGTNNILLLITEIDLNGNIIPLLRESSISALGRDMKNNILATEGIERAKLILENFINKARDYTENIYILGTSCSREAENIHYLSNWIKERFGIEYQIISGAEEAYLNGLANIDDFEGDFILFDIGGGSTEFTYIKNSLIEHRVSIKLGIRRLINENIDFRTQKQKIRRLLAEVKLHHPERKYLIGIGGTVTSIAAMQLNQQKYSGEALHGNRISYDHVDNLLNWVTKLPEIKIKELLSFEPGRSDILATGLLIVKEILEYFNASEFIVSDKGIQFGFLKKLLNNEIKSN